MISTLLSSPLIFMIFAFALVAALTIHEFSHAWVADHLGDPTPRSLGRLTLNPLAHLDPLGTLAILFIGFGWGKPVPIDPFNLRSRTRDSALIALAGPLSNLLFASVLAMIMRLPMMGFPLFSVLLPTLITLNVSLAIFNLIPIAPLDGEKVLLALLPAEQTAVYAEIMQRYGTLILIVLLFPFSGTSAVSSLIQPVISFILRFLL